MAPTAGDAADATWRVAYRVFEDALDVTPRERRAFARSATQNPKVLQLLLRLIEEEERELPDEDDASSDLESELKPGTRIGRYEIREKLGRGGMGQVYSARDSELGRTVALKLLAPTIVTTPKALARLIREAQAASSLNHPYIVTIYDVVREGANLAVAMELVEGEPLGNYCGRPQPLERVISWGRQVAQALVATHNQGVVHRDIKPDNVMVRADDCIKLLDFGLARKTLPGAVGESNLSGVMAGTFKYMSPEQTRGEPVTSASDIFSLGIVLYELSTGEHPFQAVSPIDTAQAIGHEEPKAPSRLNRAIPPALNSLLLTMLAKDPKQRPSASEVDRQLGQIDGGAVEPRRLLLKTWAAVLALCVVAAAALIALRSRSFPTVQPKLTPITTQDSDNGVTEAALSPDGTALAFSTQTGPVQLRRVSDGYTRQLSTPPAFTIDRITWFPDGKRLLVSGSPDLDQRPAVWEISIAAGAPRRLFENFTDGIPSPDGTRIAVTNSDETAIWVTDSSGGSRRYVRGSGADTVFSSLIWSPDGKRVSYQRQEYSPPRDRQVDDQSSQLFRNVAFSYESVEVDTGRVVASAAGVVMNSACSLPDGRVLFLRWIRYNDLLQREIWQLRTDPHSGRLLGPARPLTPANRLSLSSISAADNGKQIAVVNWTGSSPRLKVADLPSVGEPIRLSNIRILTSTYAFPHAWTADSREVIFESERNSNLDLFRQSIDEREAKPLVVSPGQNALAQLSTDGKWVLYRSENRVRRLMRVPVQGGKPEPIAVRGPWDEFRCPSLPGKPCVLRTVENDEFIFHELDPLRGEGGELGRTVWNPTILGDWGLAPDGSEVAIPNHDLREAKLRLVPIGEGTRGMEETTLTLIGLKNLIGADWAADGQGWFACVGNSLRSERAESRLLVYVDRTGRSSVLARSRGTLYAVPSRDGRRVAFPEERSPSNVYLVRGL